MNPLRQGIYNVTVEAFGHIRVVNVSAQSCAEAIRKAHKECGIKFEVKAPR